MSELDAKPVDHPDTPPPPRDTSADKGHFGNSYINSLSLNDLSPGGSAKDLPNPFPQIPDNHNGAAPKAVDRSNAPMARSGGGGGGGGGGGHAAIDTGGHDANAGGSPTPDQKTPAGDGKGPVPIRVESSGVTPVKATGDLAAPGQGDVVPTADLATPVTSNKGLLDGLDDDRKAQMNARNDAETRADVDKQEKHEAALHQTVREIGEGETYETGALGATAGQIGANWLEGVKPNVSDGVVLANKAAEGVRQHYANPDRTMPMVKPNDKATATKPDTKAAPADKPAETKPDTKAAPMGKPTETKPAARPADKTAPTAKSADKPPVGPKSPDKTTVPAEHTIWGQGSKIQGDGAERVLASSTPGHHIYGTFDNFDRAVYGPGGPHAPAVEVGQLKSIDTAAKSYQGAGLTRLINGVAGEMGGVGESIWEKAGHTVVIGPDTQRVLDVAIRDTPLTPRQEAAIAQAKIDCASMGVEVRIHRVH